AVWILLISPAPGREPGRGPPSDTGPPVASSAADHGPLSAAIAGPPSGTANPGQADPWHTNLIRERQVAVRLRTAQRDLEAGHPMGALTSLQSILDRDDDAFIRFPSEATPCGAHFLADRLVGGLSSRSLETYETLYGKEARQLLDAAVVASNPDLLAS